MADEPDKELYKARKAEHCESYPEMTKHVSAYLKHNEGDATEIDIKMLQVAFRNMIGKLRRAWRITKKLEKTNPDSEDIRRAMLDPSDRVKIYTEYRADLEMEITQYCKMCLDTLNAVLGK